MKNTHTISEDTSSRHDSTQGLTTRNEFFTHIILAVIGMPARINILKGNTKQPVSDSSPEWFISE